MTGKLSVLPAAAATNAELRAAARDHYRQALADGTPPSGAELGRCFAMSERWGRDRATEVNAELADGGGPASPVPPVGNLSPADPAARTPAGDEGTDTGNVATIGRADDVPIGKDGNPAATGPQPDDAGSVPAGTAEVGGGVRTVIRWVTTLTVIVVAACAARASYDHQRLVVEMAGNHEAAWYLPLSVDGMMLVASLNMLVRRWDNQPAGRLTWCALTLGGLASLAANVAAAEPTVIGRLVAAWPPICLIVSYELLMQQLPTHKQEGAPS